MQNHIKQLNKYEVEINKEYPFLKRHSQKVIACIELAEMSDSRNELLTFLGHFDYRSMT